MRERMFGRSATSLAMRIKGEVGVWGKRWRDEEVGSGRLAATIFFFQPSLRQSQNWILLEHRRDFGGKDLARVALQDKSWREKEFGRVSSFHRTSLPLSGAGHWQGRGEGGDPGGIFLSSSIHTSSPIFQFSHFPSFTPVLPFSSSPIFLPSHQFSHLPFVISPLFPYSASLLHQCCCVPNPKMVFNINLFPHCPLPLISCPPTSSIFL